MGALSPADGVLAITGAAGFLGARAVAVATARGWRVRAFVRSAASGDPLAGAPGVETVVADLATDAGQAALAMALEGVAAVIHAAGRLAGDDAAQDRDTVAPMRALVAAMTARPVPPRLVLVSSLAVYGYAALPDGATLDETAPLEHVPERRDAYCRAKLGQEAVARAAAQSAGLCVRVLRPGALFGSGRLRTARLGYALGPLLVRVGGAAPTPACDVEDAATAAVLAAETPFVRDDVPVFAPDAGAPGRFEAVNVVGDDTPDQAVWIAAIRPAGWPRLVLPAPRGPLRAVATAMQLAGAVLPGIAAHAPGPLCLEGLEARFKPLCFSNARARERLGWRPRHGFAEAMRNAVGSLQ